MRIVLGAVTVAIGTMLFGTAHAEPVTLEHDGLTLNGNLEVADGSTLKDGVVLLVHGTLAHHGMEIMAGQQERLAERGLNTLAISLGLGVDDRHGMYGCPDSVHDHRHEEAVGEIAAWIGWLDNKGAGPITVLGHSRGGNQVARFATENPLAQRVARWVLVAPMTWNEEEEAASYERRYGAPLRPLVEAAQAKVKAGDGDAVMEVPGFVYCQNAKVTAATMMSYYAPDPRFDTPRLLASMPKPVLVAIGDRDEVVPDLPERLEGNAPEGVRVSVVTDAGHMFRDFAGDDLADLVAEFVQEAD